MAGVAARDHSRVPAATAALAGARTAPAGPTPGPTLYAAGLAVRQRCTDHWCLHWVTAAPDAPVDTDRDGDGVPDAVLAAARRLEAEVPAPGEGRGHVYLAALPDAGPPAWCTGAACVARHDLAPRPADFADRLVAAVTAALAAR
ncbi:MAG: hypothetical protein R2731_14660 [Nocardioides sp.]